LTRHSPVRYNGAVARREEARAPRAKWQRRGRVQPSQAFFVGCVGRDV
jgi:hypothetical protein